MVNVQRLSTSGAERRLPVRFEVDDLVSGGLGTDGLEELTVLDEAGKLRLRVNAYLPVNFHGDKFGIWFEHLRPHQQMSPRVRIGGVKAFADRIDQTHPAQRGSS